MEHFYVVTSFDDPGSCHDTWEEAADVLQDLRKQGIYGQIFGPGCANRYPEEWLQSRKNYFCGFCHEVFVPDTSYDGWEKCSVCGGL